MNEKSETMNVFTSKFDIPRLPSGRDVRYSIFVYDNKRKNISRYLR